MRPTKKQIFTTVTAVGNSAGLPEMVVSTSSPDRDGDRIMPKGARIDNFLKNPVLCWAHSYQEIPIGTITKLTIAENDIRAAWRWLENDPLADRVKNGWNQGVVRAASIGFLPDEYTRNQYSGYDMMTWELNEISLCAVPTNAQAVRSLKSLGLWKSDCPLGEQCAMRLQEDEHDEHDHGKGVSPFAELAAALNEANRQPETIQIAGYTLPTESFKDAIKDGIKAFYQPEPQGLTPAEAERITKLARETMREIITERTGKVF